MKRHELREKSMIAIYQNLLVNTDIDELIRDQFEMEPEKLDPYFHDVINTAISHKDEYAGYIDQVLDGWTFERLGYIEKAILLLLEAAVSQGGRRLWALEKNAGAIRFYERHGFVLTGRRKPEEDTDEMLAEMARGE